jgi:excisionase family DNA binding protein
MIKISDNRLYMLHHVIDFTNKRIQCIKMTDLLTTKQVQQLLRVDRTTIYRMVEAGQLPAIRVGKQWRFERGQVDRWLGGRAVSAGLAAPATIPAEIEADASLRALLGETCAQVVQDGFADLLGVMMVITDMQGVPVTQVSNPCGYFNTLTEGNPDAISHCVLTWQQLAGAPALEPKWGLSEMGLLCTRALIRVGHELKGMLVMGGIAPDRWPPSEEQAIALAEMFGCQPALIASSAEAVHHLDRAGQEKALRSVQRIADIFSHMAEDRVRTMNSRTAMGV